MSYRRSIELPPITAKEALALVEILGEIGTAIWDAHEPEISRLAAAETYAPPPGSDEDDYALKIGLDEIPF